MTELSLRRICIVASREYLERVRTRSFLISTFATPALLAMFMILPAFITASTARGLLRDSAHPTEIVFATSNAPLAELARGELLRQVGHQYEVRVVQVTAEGDRIRFNDALLASKIGGYVWIDKDALLSHRVVFATDRLGDFVLQQRMRSSFDYAFAADSLARRGISTDDIVDLLRPVDVHMMRVGKSSSILSALRGTAVVMVLVFVMFFSLLSYGVMVMRSVMDEKASRITEVLLCSTSADELMTGKIIGTGSVGLTQIAIWLAIAAVSASRSLYLRTAIGMLELGPNVIFYFAVFYVLGYLLYSAIFAGVGAAFNTVDEAQQWNFVIMLPLVAASAMILPVATAPDSTAAIVGSLFPFCSPILMFERIAVHDPPLWQIALSLILLLAAIATALLVCGRIYRVGILMYGKRPTIRELARWLRHT